MIGIHIVGLMMLLRIFALYKSRKWIVAGVGVLLLLQAVVNAWLLTRGDPVVHEYSGVHACTMIFSSTVPSVLASASAWMPLFYDTVVVTLTVIRLLPSIWNKHPSFVVRRLLADGLLYYSVILAVTSTLTIMIISADPGIKNIAAQLELLITVTMMSRITLSLKQTAHQDRLHVLTPQYNTSKSIGFANPASIHIHTTTHSSSYL